MPLTPDDTRPTLRDDLFVRMEDGLDDIAAYVRRRPMATVGIGLVLGFLTGRAVVAQLT